MYARHKKVRIYKPQKNSLQINNQEANMLELQFI